MMLIPKGRKVGRIKPKTSRAARGNPVKERFIRSLPCLSCRRSGWPGNPIVVAHVRLGGTGGMGMVPIIEHVVPLCNDCHGTQHKGERSFWEALGMDPLKWAAYLHDAVGDVSRAASAIRNRTFQ